MRCVRNRWYLQRRLGGIIY